MMADDSCGRWFSFAAEPRTVMILEKKHLPDHLNGLPCCESPTYLSTILRELEDAGEAGSVDQSIGMQPTTLLWKHGTI